MKRLAAVLLAFLATAAAWVRADLCEPLWLQAESARRAEAFWRALAVQTGETIARIEGHLLGSANPEVKSQLDQFWAQVAALQGQQARYLELAGAARQEAERLGAMWSACVAQRYGGKYGVDLPQLGADVVTEGIGGDHMQKKHITGSLPDIHPQPDAGAGSTSTQELTITEFTAVQDALGN